MAEHLTLTSIEGQLNERVRRLRSDDLSNGYRFLIHDKNLPKGQSVYELPNGKFLIEQTIRNGESYDSIFIRELSETEIEELKSTHFAYR